MVSAREKTAGNAETRADNLIAPGKAVRLYVWQTRTRPAHSRLSDDVSFSDRNAQTL